MYYNTVVLSGGSMKAIATLGALQYCFDNNLLHPDNIHTYAGTSAGAILSYLMIIGYSPIEVLCYVVMEDLIKNPHYLNLANLFSGEGAMSFFEIYDHLEKLTINKIGRLITFKDIKLCFGKNILVAVYNLTKKQVEYLSPESTPDMPCLTGLRMSCSLPFIFNKCRYEGCDYIDGGVADNFPISRVEEDGNRVLGFHINIFGLAGDEDALIPTIYSILSIPLIELEKRKLDNSSADIIYIDRIKYSMLDFNITSKEKLDMFSDGYQIAQDHFEKEKE